VEIEITKAELEEKFFSVRLTIVDTPGFGDYVNSKEAWAPIVEFLDDQVPHLDNPHVSNPTARVVYASGTTTKTSR
jgi:Septin